MEQHGGLRPDVGHSEYLQEAGGDFGPQSFKILQPSRLNQFLDLLRDRLANTRYARVRTLRDGFRDLHIELLDGRGGSPIGLRFERDALQLEQVCDLIEYGSHFRVAHISSHAGHTIFPHSEYTFP